MKDTLTHIHTLSHTQRGEGTLPHFQVLAHTESRTHSVTHASTLTHRVKDTLTHIHTPTLTQGGDIPSLASHMAHTCTRTFTLRVWTRPLTQRVADTHFHSQNERHTHGHLLSQSRTPSITHTYSHIQRGGHTPSLPSPLTHRVMDTLSHT